MNCASSNIRRRIFHRARNVLAAPGQSNGRNLYTAAVSGANQALCRAKAGLSVGVSADFVSLDPSHPSLAGKTGDAILDTWIFADGAKVDCVWVRGKKLVEGGRHFRREAIAQKFRTVMMELVYT